MPDPTDGQKEVQVLQSRILNLEEGLKNAIEKLKTKPDSKPLEEKIETLEKELIAVKREREELIQKIWDGKNRRAKERRIIRVPGNREIEPIDREDDDVYSGHF